MTQTPHSSALSGPSSTTAHVLVGTGATASVEDDWRRLAERAGNPFLTPEWAHSWHAHHPEATPVVCAVVREDGTIAGLLPLALSRTGRFTHELAFPGDDLGDDFAPLADDGVDPVEVAAAAGEALAREPLRWDAVRLAFVAVDAPWVAAFARALPPVRRFVVRRAGRPVIRVGDSDWTGYMAGLQRTVRKETRRTRRRLEESHEIEYHRAEPGEVASATAELMRLHDMRWGDRSSIPAGTRRDVITAFCAAAAERDWLRLWLLRADGSAVAAELAWRVGDRQVHYQGGFDPEWQGRGIGITMMIYAIEAEWDQGVREFDLCQGTADYKVRYSTEVVEVETVRLVRATRPARVTAEIDHLLRDVIAPRLPARVMETVNRLRRGSSSS